MKMPNRLLAPPVTRPARFAACVVAALLLSGCGDASAPEPEADPMPPSAPTGTPEGTEPTDVARRVVADFLALPMSEITVVSIESKDFSDTSLDCPQPGMSYAQVITPGHRVVVEADGRRFDVRVAGRAGRICRKPANRGQSPGTGEPRRAPTTQSAPR